MERKPRFGIFLNTFFLANACASRSGWTQVMFNTFSSNVSQIAWLVNILESSQFFVHSEFHRCTRKTICSRWPAGARATTPPM